MFGLGGRARDGFDIAATAPAVATDDVQSGLDALKPYYALYIGGMGARGKNFYNSLFARYGYEDEAREIQDLFLDGKQRDAAAKVPDAFVDDVALVGSRERIAERLAAWRESGATSLLVSARDANTLRVVAEAAAVNLFDLDGKVAIVTGGGSGIGRQMATGLAEAGAELVLCARKVERCEEAAAAMPTRALALPCDVTDQDSVGAMVPASSTSSAGSTSSSTMRERSGAPRPRTCR